MRIDWSAGLGAVLVALTPATIAAQAVPGTRLDVQVQVASITVSGGEVAIAYRLQNAAVSTEDLFTFTVESPAPPVLVELPAPADAWATASRFRDSPVARWTALEPVVPPGSESPLLRMRAAGLPAIVQYWVQGYTPPAPLTDADTAAHVPPDNPLTQRSRTGHTVGVEPIAPNAALTALADRLAALNATTCGELAWISSDGVCQSLTAKLSAARASIVADRPSAIQQLHAYVNELEAQNGLEAGKTVSDEAYWLLRTNAEAVLSRL